MTRLGITGHSNLTVESAPLVAAALRAELAAHASDGLVGVSCLARGADQIFARAVLELDGALEVVLPFGGLPQAQGQGRQRRSLR